MRAVVLILEQLECVMLAMSNLADYSLIEGLDASSTALANAAISAAKIALDISLGVTPFAAAVASVGDAKPAAGTAAAAAAEDLLQREWVVSACVSPNEVLGGSRRALLAAAGALVTLYGHAEPRSQTAHVSLLTAPGKRMNPIKIVFAIDDDACYLACYYSLFMLYVSSVML